MKRRNVEATKYYRKQFHFRKYKFAESIYASSTFLYVKFLAVWALIMIADFMLEFRFEFLWPVWLVVRSLSDSFRYQGIVSVLFIGDTQYKLCRVGNFKTENDQSDSFFDSVSFWSRFNSKTVKRIDVSNFRFKYRLRNRLQPNIENQTAKITISKTVFYFKVLFDILCAHHVAVRPHVLHFAARAVAVLRRQHVRVGAVRVAHGAWHLSSHRLALAALCLHRGRPHATTL